MEIYRKIGYFLKEYAWLPKLCVWIFLLVWATQFHVFLSAQTKLDKSRGKYYTEVNQMLFDIEQRMDFEARKKGTAYGPKEYFADLKWLQLKRIELDRKYDSRSGERSSHGAWNVMFENMRNGLYSDGELSKYRDEFKLWQKRNDPERLRWQNNTYTVEKLKKDLCDWAIKLYTRGFFLVLMLYLCRMVQNRGIFATILAEKKRFVISVILWPVFIIKYPHNVIREIIVEAELRRMSDAFRKLTGTERLFIRDLANSSEYKNWLFAYRARNQGNFRRGLLVAIIIVLMLQCALPRINIASNCADESRAGPKITWVQNAPLQDDAVDGLFNIDHACEIISFEYSPIVVMSKFRLTPIRVWKKIFVDSIDHIPLKAVWLSDEFVLITKTAGA